MTEPSDTVRLEVNGGVGVIRLDRPPLNALDRAMQLRLGELAAEVAHRDDIEAVVLFGGDQVFAAGADVKEMSAMSRAEMTEHAPKLQRVFAAVAALPQPVVAAVTGYALGGGCELALCADHRVAADDATLGQPEIKLGLIPGAGGTQRLTRLVGPSRAKDLILTGRSIPAGDALTIGLVDQVVPAAEVFATARAWAAQFVGGPRMAVRAAKACIDRAFDLELADGLEQESRQFADLFGTEDRGIGMEAFRTRQDPRFTGR